MDSTFEDPKIQWGNQTWGVESILILHIRILIINEIFEIINFINSINFLDFLYEESQTDLDFWVIKS